MFLDALLAKHIYKYHGHHALVKDAIIFAEYLKDNYFTFRNCVRAVIDKEEEHRKYKIVYYVKKVL